MKLFILRVKRVSVYYVSFVGRYYFGVLGVVLGLVLIWYISRGYIRFFLNDRFFFNNYFIN